MSHLVPVVMRRVLRGEAGAQEAERTAEHLMACVDQDIEHDL
jgi:hypothetical protein